MCNFVRCLVPTAILVLTAWVHPASAQTAPAKGAAPAPVGKVAAPAKPMADPVMATVNGEPIKKSEVIQMLSNYSLPPGKEEDLYTAAVNAVASLKLLQQFLITAKVDVAAKEVDDTIAKIREELKSDNRSLEEALATNGLSVDDLKKQVSQSLRWKNYVFTSATDPVLKKHFDANKDLYNRNQVRASHILVKLEPDSSADKKAAAVAKLTAVKKEIDSGKITFAEAANKYSEDDGNVETKAGGDLGFFLIKGQFDEKFAQAAFKMKKGTISDPVETVFGYHLIQVTDRKDGPPADFEANKPLITNTIAVELQEKIVEDQRKAAKIVINPMPADFFPKAPVAPENLAPPTGKPATKGAAPKK